MSVHSGPHVRARVAPALSAVALLLLAGCAPPLVLPSPAGRVAPPGADAPALAQPIVQLRYFGFSPDVDVVAWSPEEAAWGLRSVVRRDGTLVTDHRIFVSSWYEPGMPRAGDALLSTQRLLVTGVSQDTFACWFGDCSPLTYFGARIPDDLLRTSADSVRVKFYGVAGRELTIVIRPEVVSAYLAVIDSVSATLRRRTSPD